MKHFSLFVISFFFLSLQSKAIEKDSVSAQKTKQNLKKIQRVAQVLFNLNFSDNRENKDFFDVDHMQDYNGKIIRDIHIKILDPYGLDTSNLKKNSFYKFANKTQFKTPLWAVKKDVLFFEGEYFNAQKIYETEKILWERGVFKNIHIVLDSVADSKYIDILILVKDRWSWSVQSALEFSRVQVGLKLNNPLGLTHSWTNNIALNYDRNNIFAVIGNYNYYNIHSTQMNFRTDYNLQKNSQSVSLNLYRNYFSLSSHWALNFRCNFSNYSSSIPSTITHNSIGSIRRINTDLWASYSFSTGDKLVKKFPKTQFVLGLRIKNSSYLRRPFVNNSDYTEIFMNYTSALVSFGFSNWSFYNDKNIFYLDIMEYYNKGLSAAIVLGPVTDEQLNDRFYSGFNLNYGYDLKKGGFANTKLSYGAFLTNYVYDQILLNYENTYFSPKFKIGKAFFRQHIKWNLNLGFNRPTGRELNLVDENAIKGFTDKKFKGNKNITLKVEEDVIANFKVLGFSSILYLFGNLSFQSNDYLVLKQSDLVQAYGIGLKLRNVNFGIEFIDISLAYYPLMPKGFKPYSYNFNFLNNEALPNNTLYSPDVMNLEKY